jgi:DMSO/TMAO reductase YedYZ molybdopterin-dependent catalytic subunit
MTLEMNMADMKQLARRRFLARAAGGIGGLMLGSCDRLSENLEFTRLLKSAEAVTRFAQRIVVGRTALAREYAEADLVTEFRANGTTEPSDPEYQRLAQNRFADWQLVIGGLVEQPRYFSLAELKELPSRTQITWHDCVEGWSCIGKWKGARLAALLASLAPALTCGT